jgi:hypothetical protein
MGWATDAVGYFDPILDPFLTSFWTPYFDHSSRKQEIIQVYSVKQPPEYTPKMTQKVTPFWAPEPGSTPKSTLPPGGPQTPKLTPFWPLFGYTFGSYFDCLSPLNCAKGWGQKRVEKGAKTGQIGPKLAILTSFGPPAWQHLSKLPLAENEFGIKGPQKVLKKWPFYWFVTYFGGDPPN